MRWQTVLEEHGEVEVRLENDAEYELHLDTEFFTPDDEEREMCKFVDSNGEKHEFYVDMVVDHTTHPSEKLA